MACSKGHFESRQKFRDTLIHCITYTMIVISNTCCLDFKLFQASFSNKEQYLFINKYFVTCRRVVLGEAKIVKKEGQGRGRDGQGASERRNMDSTAWSVL